jgi:hypothetical protein
MALTRDQLLDIWRKSFDPSYVDPLEEEADGLGVDVIASIAALMARVAASIETTTQALYVYPHSIQTAPPGSGEAQSTGSITITRAAPTDGDIELLEGDQLDVSVRTVDGVDAFELTIELAADQTLADGSKGPYTVATISSRPGYQTNAEDTQGRSLLFSTRTTVTVENATSTILNKVTDTGSGDRFDASMVGAFVRFTAGPNSPTVPRRITAVSVGSVTTTITVDGAALVAGAGNTVTVVDVNELGVFAELDGDMTGGVHGWLDANGRERGIGRNAGESDALYRERARALPDTVSPNAIYRAASRILTPEGIAFAVIESRGPEITDQAWDVMPYDDTPADVGLLGRNHFYQGDGFLTRGFYIVVERGNEGEFGFFYDGSPAVGEDNAWDFAGYDGYPIGFWGTIAALTNEIEKTRMAGVPWLLVLVDSI